MLINANHITPEIADGVTMGVWPLCLHPKITTGSNFAPSPNRFGNFNGMRKLWSKQSVINLKFNFQKHGSAPQKASDDSSIEESDVSVAA